MLRARPLVIVVPIHATEERSARGVSSATGWGCLSVEADSPVSDDSSAFMLTVSRRRTSAGTRSPTSSNTTSPGTRVAASMVVSMPDRSTVLVGASIFWRASMAFSARHSWTNPSTPFSTTITMIVIASVTSPSAKEIRAAMTRITIRTSTNWRASTAYQGVAAPVSISLRPNPVESLRRVLRIEPGGCVARQARHYFAHRGGVPRYGV